MERKNNARCAICDTPYYICKKCMKLEEVDSWRMHVDTPAHYGIFAIIRGYTTGVFTKAEAKEQLENADLSDMDTYRESVKSVINEIMNTTTKVKKASKKLTEKSTSVKENNATKNTETETTTESEDSEDSENIENTEDIIKDTDEIENTIEE